MIKYSMCDVEEGQGVNRLGLSSGEGEKMGVEVGFRAGCVWRNRGGLGKRTECDSLSNTIDKLISCGETNVTTEAREVPKMLERLLRGVRGGHEESGVAQCRLERYTSPGLTILHLWVTPIQNIHISILILTDKVISSMGYLPWGLSACPTRRRGSVTLRGIKSSSSRSRVTTRLLSQYA